MKKLDFKRQFWLCLWLVVCGLLSLGQLQKVSVTENISFYIHDVVIAGWLMLAAFRERNILLQQLKALPRWLSIFCGWGILSLIANQLLNNGFSASPWLYLIRLGMYLIWIIYLQSLFQRQKLQPSQIILGVLLTTGLLAWFGILQYIFLPDTRELLYLGWDDHYYRLISTLLDPAFTGLTLTFGWWIAYAAFPWPKFAVFQKFLVVLFSISILLTYSRSTYVALAAGIISFAVILFIQSERKKAALTALFLPIFAVGITLLPRPAGEGVRLERNSTIIARQENIVQTVKNFTPWTLMLGKGLFTPEQDTTSTYSDHSRIPDNWAIWILQATGIIGLLIALWVGKDLVMLAWRKQNAGLPVLLGILIHGLFNASIVYPWTLLVAGPLLIVLLGKSKR